MSTIRNAVVSTVALLGSTVLAAPAAMINPWGVLQSPSHFPVGTLLEFAVIRPEGMDYLCSNYAINTPPSDCAPIYIARGTAPNPRPRIRLTTMNETGSDGCTDVKLTDEGFGLSIGSDGRLEVKSQQSEASGFYVQQNSLKHMDAPHGFYYCGDPTNPDPSSSYTGVQSATNTYSTDNGGTGNCHQATFIAFTASV